MAKKADKIKKTISDVFNKDEVVSGIVAFNTQDSPDDAGVYVKGDGGTILAILFAVTKTIADDMGVTMKDMLEAMGKIDVPDIPVKEE